MSTITAAPVAARAAYSVNPNASSLSFGGVMRSEWIKLRSLRSTAWSYLILIAVWVGLALLMSLGMSSSLGESGSAGVGPAEMQSELVIMSATFGAVFGQLIVAVLGVLVISGEYTTGMIRSTFTAVPRRIPAFTAKALVLFVTTFVVGLVSAIAAFIVSSVVYGMHGVSASITDPDTFLPLVGAALYLAFVSLLALGFGTMLRSSAGGIAAVLGILMLLPMVLQMIPVQWSQDLVPYLFSIAGMDIFGQTAITENWDSVAKNVGIVAVWLLAAVTGALLLLKKRDA